MSSVLKSSDTVAPDGIQERNLLYVITGWYPEPERMDTFSHITNKAALVELPDPNDHLHSFVGPLTNIFRTFVTKVESCSFQMRAAVSDSADRCGGAVPRIITSLQTENSVGEYCRVYTRLVLFAIKLTTQTAIATSEDIVTGVEAFMRAMDRQSVCKLVLSMLTESTVINRDTTAVIPLFVRFNCHRADGSLADADFVQRLCAKLMYLAKVCVLEKAMDAPEPDRVEAIIELKKCVEVDHFNIFSFLVSIKGLAHRVVQSTNRFPVVSKTSDDNPWNIIIRGIHLRLDQLRHVYSSALAKSKALLVQLLLGLEFRPNPFDNLALGSRIMADKIPSLDQSIRCSLLRHILATESLRTRFVCTVKDDMVQYRAGEVNKYLAMFDEFVENLIVLIHVGSGMPARSTEMETYRIVNGSSAYRTVFFLNGQVFLHCWYSKTRAVRQANRGVSRFLDPEASSIVLTDLLVIRPFVCSLSSFVEQNDDNIHGTHLFASGGKRLSSDQIRNAFARLFHKYCGSTISFAEYRHVAKYYSLQLHLNNCHRDDNSSEEEEGFGENISASAGWDTLVNKQFGHSTSTSNTWYGIEAGEPQHMRLHVLEGFRDVSQIWHRFLKGSAAPYTSGKVSRISVVNGLSNSSSECSLGAAASSGSVRRQTALVTVQQSEDALLCLRSVYKDDHAQFKSSQQRAAVENVLHTGSNLLVILPTGCGKSLVFFTYAVKYANTTSLLVVPTISLKQDLARRAQNLGVSCSCTPLTVTREQLVIVTPEAVVQGSEVTELLTRLHSSGQLGKIFVDEAHMFSTECGYRPLYRQLPGPLGSFSSPLVLMTATAPQWIVEDLMQNFFGPARMPYSLVIRQTTSRPNLAYTFDESGRTSNLVRCCAQFVSSNVPEDRIIIYVPSVDIMHSVKHALDAAGDIEITSATYSGQQEANENASNFILWREGQVKIMVATSAFGVGIDYAHVRQVISFGLCYSVEDYAQMMGRAGRDGEPSVALTLFDRNAEVARSHHLTTTAFDDMLHFATMKQVCRRRYLARYLDGTETECSHDPLNQSCDTCMQQHGPQGTRSNDEIGEEDIFANLPDSVFVDCTHGQNLVCATRDLGEQLWFYLNRFKAMCIVCWAVSGISANHGIKSCPMMHGKCLRCFGPHAVNKCIASNKRTISGTCPRCYLPEKLGVTVFHPDGFSKGCLFGETLKFFGLAVVKITNVATVDIYERDERGILKLWNFFVEYSPAR